MDNSRLETEQSKRSGENNLNAITAEAIQKDNTGKKNLSLHPPDVAFGLYT